MFLILINILDEHLSRTSSDSKNSSLLRISLVQYENAGTYECVADNGIEPIIKTNFTLTIRGKDFCIFQKSRNSFLERCNISFELLRKKS